MADDIPVSRDPYPGRGLALGQDGKIPLSVLPPTVASASTVAGLGTASDGKLGMLRLGSTPFDFLSLTYDATYGKWVSDTKVIASAYQFTTPNTAFTAWGGLSYDAILPYRLFANAGLSIQARQTVGLSNPTGGAHVATTDLFTQTVDTGGAFNAAVTFGGAMSMTQTGSTTKFVDSNWVTIAPGALTDWVLIEPVVKSDAAGTAQVLIGTVWVRMVG